MSYTFLQIIYGLNILVAGFVGISSLFFPEVSSAYVFERTLSPNWAQRILGGFWLSVALLSILGLFQPLKFSPVLLIQLIYKALWLVVVVMPMLRQGRLNELPMGITWFFLTWVLALLLVLPYDYLFGDFG